MDYWKLIWLYLRAAIWHRHATEIKSDHDDDRIEIGTSTCTMCGTNLIPIRSTFRVGQNYYFWLHRIIYTVHREWKINPEKSSTMFKFVYQIYNIKLSAKNKNLELLS